MPKSMTGYGRGDFSIGNDTFAVEVKSLNHRFIDMNLRMPERFYPLENRMREEIKGRFSRGSFSVFLTSVSMEAPQLKLNIQAAKLYLDAAAELKKEFGIKSEIDAGALLKLKDVFSLEKKGPASESDWTPLKEALDKAFAQLEDWRKKEGENLKADLLQRLDSLEGLVFHVEARAPKTLEAYKERLKEEIEKLIKDKVDEARILLEAAMFAERTDINEEIARLKSHLDMFRKFLKFDEPVGKRLDFLCQEIGREVNTIGSKANDIKITQTVIEMKGDVEKIREQVQNIE